MVRKTSDTNYNLYIYWYTVTVLVVCIMGLFVLDLARETNSKTRVETAIKNLELYLQEDNPDYDYLIEIAQGQLYTAMKMAQEEKE